jgi:hypothetical protein
MTQKLDTIHHVAIQVNHIGQSVVWYTQRYACKVDYQDDTWAMLKFSNISLALVLSDQHPYHISILADDLEPYGKAESHRDGTQFVYIQDVDGNNIEMLKMTGEKASI